MARPKKYWPMVLASQDEAALAVRLHNDPSENRSLEGFVVHMHLAWLYLLHASMTQDGVDYRYRRRDKPHLIEKVDGEPKLWELAHCMNHHWPDPKHPVRANLEFFIMLRNRIEHRYFGAQEALASIVGGQTQALLLNYENEVTALFGVRASLAARLRFPVFIGSFTSEGEQALLKLRGTLPASLRKLLSQYHSGLDESITEDSRYSFRIRIFQELVRDDADALPVQFTRLENMSPGDRAMIERLGQDGRVIVRNRIRNVVGADELKPAEVVEAVRAQMDFCFTMHHFALCWRRQKVRPPTDSDHPEDTDEKYCTYHKLSNSYGYRKAFVERLAKECKTEEGFLKWTGKYPEKKPCRSRCKACADSRSNSGAAPLK